MIAKRKIKKTNVLTYAVISDDGKNQVSNYPAYAVKGDDSKERSKEHPLILPTTVESKKESKPIKNTNPKIKAYAA